MKSFNITGCRFCRLIGDPSERQTRTCGENVHYLAIEDLYPVAPGHTLVIPKRHSIDFTTCDGDDLDALGVFLRQQVDRIMEETGCDGVNVGTNIGSAAGQTVYHTHWHLIPRWAGDNDSPVGGIRKVLTGDGSYVSY